MSRLPTKLVASGLLRAAEATGGNGVVLAKGDPDAGALMLILTSRGADPRLYERVSSQEHGFTWNIAADEDSLTTERVARLIDSRKRFDADLWIVELDIPNAEQFLVDSLAET